MKKELFCLLVVILFSSCLKEPTTGPQTSIGAPPADFYLRQNYPNPFVDTTTIKYGVPISGGTASTVTIIVYDPLREPVRTLVNNNAHPAGGFATKWDGRNSRGIQVPSGTYTIEMQGFTPQTVIIRITAIKK
ncbi:MAG: FlgD immunoglobulin-like domain containing protein [Bacteroidota bacterium]